MTDTELMRTELAKQRRLVDFDTYDITVDELVRRVEKGRIEVAPAYQRQFRWDSERQSRLIESLYLGIPVPPLFMATNVTETGQNWEVVDGLQRLLTLVSFISDQQTQESVGIHSGSSVLKKLEKLPTFEGMKYSGLPEDIRNALEDRPLKVIVLNDKSDKEVRFDLFQRINTGGIKLTDHEVRECVFIGPFIDLLRDLSESRDFQTVVRLPRGNKEDGTAQEFVLRFFAYLENYKNFDHSVKDFLNEFCKEASKEPELESRRKTFEETFKVLAEHFPEGVKSRKGSTPVNLFEAFSVGAALALESSLVIDKKDHSTWLFSDEMKLVTTGATNSKPRVRRRIELARDNFLGV